MSDSVLLAAAAASLAAILAFALGFRFGQNVTDAEWQAADEDTYDPIVIDVGLPGGRP